jgi:hypothetical protein
MPNPAPCPPPVMTQALRSSNWHMFFPFRAKAPFQEAVLDLCRGTDDDFVDVNLSRLFDGERDSAGDCRRW